ncbi:MAG TPA: hypothetical protein VN207_05105 [Ktedonobacteraceae bacterium]|nr:hypothetical protein [Ktedonobacteraceae bacterium]
MDFIPLQEWEAKDQAEDDMYKQGVKQPLQMKSDLEAKDVFSVP